MKFKYEMVLICVAIWITLAGLVVVLRQDNQKRLDFDQAKFSQQLKLKCQELSANATNPKWTYKGCINEMGFGTNKIKVN